jgi:acetyl-CoA acetyltransferase family protein
MSSRDPAATLALVAGWRTPFSKAGTAMQGASAADLATHVFREVLDRTGFDPAKIDEVILGCAGQEAREANVARVAALRAGVPRNVPAVTVMRNCASGMEALFAAQERLRAGDGSVFLVGGAESMSNFPLLMGPQLVQFFTGLQKAKSAWQRLRALLRFRFKSLRPRIALVEGLTDPTTGLMMGNTAENVARLFGITREDMDGFALASHQRAAHAQQNGNLEAEIAPYAAPPRFPTLLAQDNGVRTEQTLEALAGLQPVFDRKNGDVTVGNACQVTDGAVALLCMSEDRAKAEGLRPLAVVRGHARAALDPALMGLGPVHAAPKALAAAGIGFRDLELFEINEAFAAQVLGCQKAAASDTYCQRELGLPGALGEIPSERLNVNGGAIALGHPIAASGARLALTLAHEMRRQGRRYGLAALCVGGGQGQAMVLEAT